MGKYIVDVSKQAQNHLAIHHKSGNKNTIKKIQQIFLELSENPYEGIGQPELLKYDFEGYWSRRINKKDRQLFPQKDITKINED